VARRRRGPAPALRAAMGVSLLVLTLAGCAIPAPLAEKFFDMSSPENTLKGFVYAVDTHQWEYAHRSLTAETQKEVSQFKLQAAVLFATVPKVNAPLFDLISNALYGRFPAEPVANRDDIQKVIVQTKARDEEGRVVYVEVALWFVLEDREWRFDLLGSLNGMGMAAS
jgi:hypothetical protein